MLSERTLRKILMLLLGIIPVLAVGQYVPPIQDISFGYLLPGTTNCAVWWCEATYKVGRERIAPTHSGGFVRIAAARNEYEPFQIVLRPGVSLSNVTVSVADFVLQGGSSNVLSATNVEICLVEYVPVVTPTDAYSTNGLHPDPLPPLTAPFEAAAGSNQPLWITVYVPKEAPAGEYLGAVTIHAGQPIQVPVRLEVFDFGLSDVTHTPTGYYADAGVYWGGAYSQSPWHLLSNQVDMQCVWDFYMQNFRKHRVAPFAPHYYSPITWGLTNGQFTIDFTAFDQAMARYVDEFGFNTFNLMGHKTPDLPVWIGDHKQFSPGYRESFGRLMKPIMAHLRENGWAEKAYCYWIDEPMDPSLETNVLAGMDTLATCAPGLRRLITVQYGYAPSFNGQAEIWTSYPSLAWGFDFPGRQTAGEEVWWYYCIGPTAPRPNNFVDHPALNHRIRFWMTERYGIGGDLYWSTINWQSNPWTNASQYASGGYNGDGTLLYPPTRDWPTTPQMAGPINSIRWELIREGLEDLEYVWLLKQRLQPSRLSLGPAHPAVVEGNAALQAALGLVTSMEEFEHDPQVLYAARSRIAAAIAALDDGAPMVVRQPVSRAVLSGGSTVLRTEVLAWPLPAYQWRCNGVSVPGATNAVLTLTNLGPLQVGAYTLVASNAGGAVTSAVAQVEGRWSEPPRIVSQPQPLVREIGGRAVFAVTAVSTNPLAYDWRFNGAPVSGASATNTTLALTNLTLSRAGDYSVVISNLTGVVTSATARLVVLLATNYDTLVPAAGVWRYHDAGADLGTAWREPAFDDSAWSQGAAPLGYGNGNEATLVGGESNPNTVYFRRTFVIQPPPLPTTLTGRLKRDDGAVAYLNGTEIFRNNLPTGTVSFATCASGVVNGSEEELFLVFSIPPELLQPGPNVLAVEVHQNTNEIVRDVLAVARWSLDESGPPWNDSIGTNHLDTVGTNVIAATGIINGCASNSASATAHLTAADSPELSYSGPFTVGGWFAWGASGLESICVQKAGEFKLSYSGTAINRYRFELNGRVIQDRTGGTTPGQWRFVVAWYDGTNACIQVDNGAVYSTNATAPPDTTSPLILLKKADPSGGVAADEVFLFKGALDARERTALFNSLPLPMTTDLGFDLTMGGPIAIPPVFLSEPASLLRNPGESAAFAVTVASPVPASFQWLFNDQPIPGATNTLLFLGSATTNNLGEYRLTAGNYKGTVTSAPATLRFFDSDGDLMPDEWEIANGLNPWNPADAAWDGDSDGLSNCGEHLAGRNPWLRDNLHFTAAAFLPQGGFQMSVFGESNKTYLLEACTNLPDWTPLRLFTCTNRPMVVLDPTADWYPQRFYRVAPLTAMPKPTLSFAPTNPVTPARVQMVLNALPGAGYRIEVSTNLRDWTTLTNLSVQHPLTGFSDGNTNRVISRFYRAVLE